MASGRRRRWALGGGLAVITAAVVASPAQIERADAGTAPTSGATKPASSSSAESGETVSLVSPVAASQPSVSGTGQFVAFVSAPGTEDGRTSSVWLQDRASGELTELSQPNPNVRTGDSLEPVISADGCVVVITTQIAYDVFRDDDKGTRWDVYRTTLPACGGTPNEWTLVSTKLDDEGLAQARGDVDANQPAAISGSGTVIAYVRPMTVVAGVKNPANHPSSIEVVDLTTPVDDPLHTVSAPGLPLDIAESPVLYGGQGTPTLSADGNIVVFTSDATSDQAVPAWNTPADKTNTAPREVFAWDRSDGDPFTAVAAISAGAGGVANASAVAPAVSADGRFIAFASAATNLVPSPELDACAATCAPQIYVLDRDTDNNQVLGEKDTTAISIVSALSLADGTGFTIGNGASFTPTLSSDGNTLVFATQATNLLDTQTAGGGEVGDGDLITADLTTKQLRRSFPTAAPIPGAYSHPHLSANSRVLVADSLVADRLLGDPAVTGRHVVAASFVPAVSMADLDLGTVVVSVPGPEWFINVVNAGPGTFLPATVSTDNPDFAVTGGSCLDLAAVPAGQSCSVKVVLTPSAAGPLSATLITAEAGFGALTLTAPLTGAGGDPALLAAPSSADLGSAVVGQTSTETASFDVFNIFFDLTTVTSVAIGGADAKDFAIDRNGCAGVVASGASCPIRVSFTPTDAGRRTASVSVTTSLGQYTSMLLSGSGFYSPLLISPASATPGRDLGIGGTGYPANTGIVVGWSDGSGRSVLLTTDKHGNFITFFPVALSQRPGPTTLIAQVPNGPSSSATVDIDRLRKRSSGAPGSRG